MNFLTRIFYRDHNFLTDADGVLLLQSYVDYRDPTTAAKMDKKLKQAEKWARENRRPVLRRLEPYGEIQE